MPRSTAQFLLAAGLTLALAACGGKRPPETAVPMSDTQPATPAATTDDGSAARDAEAARQRAEAAARARAALEARIHFGYDQADLSAAARTTLDAKVPVLAADPAIALRIEGHADERGSDEYNLALGNRRAAAAKRYLVQQGIAADRLEVVSLGEEQPLETGHDEAAWAANRRAEFRVSAGLGAR